MAWKMYFHIREQVKLGNGITYEGGTYAKKN